MYKNLEIHIYKLDKQTFVTKFATYIHLYIQFDHKQNNHYE